MDPTITKARPVSHPAMNDHLVDLGSEIRRRLGAPCPVGCTLRDASIIGNRLQTAADIIDGRITVTTHTFTATTDDTEER